jgi:hypothetical protein
LLAGCSLGLFASCQRRAERPAEQRGEFVVLDSSRAAALIARDTVEYFFDRIGRIDMGLQLRTCFPDTVPRRRILAQYRDRLRQDVSTFSEREEALLRSQLHIVRQWAIDMGVDLFPDSLFLLKSRGSLYGEGAFFTRGRAIVIPQSALERPDRAELRRTLLHELFHIYSRLHPGQRKALYRIIGFVPLDGPVLLPDILAGQRLLNPDGLADSFALRLAYRGDSLLGYPLVRAKPACYQPEQEGYFSYLDFQVYPLSKREEGEGFAVSADSLGNSPISYYELPSFFDQIGDNTSYIIHPDEILADNLALMFLLEYDAGQLNELVLSERGRQILEDMREVLTR